MRRPSRSSTSAIILAGGRGQRLGGCDKARLRWRGQSLLQRLSAQLQRVACEVIVVRARPRDALRLPHGSVRAWDQQSAQGPLSGLAAGLQRASGRWCLCVPVDCANLPPDLLAQLARGSHHGGYARHLDDHYYLHCLLPRHARNALGQFRRSGGRSASNACRTLGLEPVTISCSGTIWSLNTREELRHRLRRRV